MLEKVILAGLALSAISTSLFRSKLPTRGWVKCVYCFSHWPAFIIALLWTHPFIDPLKFLVEMFSIVAVSSITSTFLERYIAILSEEQ